MEKATRGDGEPRDGGARWGTSGGKPRRGRPGGMAGGEPGAGGDGRPRGGRAGRSEPETGAPYKQTPPHAWLYEPPFQSPGQWHTWECTTLVAHHSSVLLAGGSRVHLSAVCLCFGSGPYAGSPDPYLNVHCRISRLQLLSLFLFCVSLQVDPRLQASLVHPFYSNPF